MVHRVWQRLGKRYELGTREHVVVGRLERNPRAQFIHYREMLVTGARPHGLEGQRALPKLRKALETALKPFVTKDGVRMRSAAWIVLASCSTGR